MSPAGRSRPDATAPSSAMARTITALAAHFAASAATITELQIELCEMAAPTGHEADRGAAVARWLRAAGCQVTTDAAGNVLGVRGGAADGPAVVVATHLDTVFPPGQPVAVARGGQRSPYRGARVPRGELHGPGIADAAAGLAALIALAQGLATLGVATVHPIWFLTTVGEEGRGDLRGIRAFLAAHDAAEIAAFLTIDHPEPGEIVHRGVGSHRFEATFSGAGGHAWGHAGRYNPGLAMAAAARRLGQIPLPGHARTTLNVGVLEAGRAINAIPEHARLELDLRSEDAAVLDALDLAVQEAIKEGEAEERRQRPQGAGTPGLIRIGARPAGVTPLTDPLVVAAQDALRAGGWEPVCVASSTDANAVMAAGIPAIGLGWGGRTAQQHSLRESFAPAGRERSLVAIARVVLGGAGIALD